MNFPPVPGMAKCLSSYFMIITSLCLWAPLLHGQQYISLHIDVHATNSQETYRVNLSRLPVVRHCQAVDADYYGPLQRHPLVLFRDTRNAISFSLQGIKGNWTYHRIIADLQMGDAKISRVEVQANRLTFHLIPPESSVNSKSILSARLFLPEQDRSICFDLPVKWEIPAEVKTSVSSDPQLQRTDIPANYSRYRLQYSPARQKMKSTSFVYGTATPPKHRRPGRRMFEQSMPMKTRSAIPQGYNTGTTIVVGGQPTHFVGPMRDEYRQTTAGIPQSYQQVGRASAQTPGAAARHTPHYAESGGSRSAGLLYATWGSKAHRKKVSTYNIPY